MDVYVCVCHSETKAAFDEDEIETGTVKGEKIIERQC